MKFLVKNYCFKRKFLVKNYSTMAEYKNHPDNEYSNFLQKREKIGKLLRHKTKAV